MQRHRMIYSALSEELSQGLHALSLKTKTPEELRNSGGSSEATDIVRSRWQWHWQGYDEIREHLGDILAHRFGGCEVFHQTGQQQMTLLYIISVDLKLALSFVPQYTTKWLLYRKRQLSVPRRW